MEYAVSRINTDRGGRILRYVDAKTLEVIAAIEDEYRSTVKVVLYTPDGKGWPRDIPSRDGTAAALWHLANRGYDKDAHPGYNRRLPGDPSPHQSMCE